MKRQGWWIDFAKKRGDKRDPLAYDQSPLAVETDAEANLVSSALEDPAQRMLDLGYAPLFGAVKHAPALDLDVPARLVPSSTPGHSHLYIDVEVDWLPYTRLLDALADCGIVERGYAEACKRQGATYLRPEGIAKNVNDAKPVPAQFTEPGALVRF